jgi:hypothetical protein
MSNDGKKAYGATKARIERRAGEIEKQAREALGPDFEK